MKKMTYKTTLHGCYIGYLVQAINVNLTPVLFVIFQDSYNISLNMLSALILCNFAMQITIDLFSAKISDLMGYRKTMLFALSLATIGLLLLGFLPLVMSSTFVAIFIASMIFSTGSGLLEVVISPVTDSLPLGEKKSSMALLHSFYCWGQLGVVLLSTLFIKLFGANLWYILPFIWALVPITDLVLFCFVPLTPQIKASERMPAKTLFGNKTFILAMIIMLCAGASEMVISQWSSLFAERGLGVSKFLGDLLGPCIFALLMGVGRLLYGLYGAKWDISKVLIGCSVLCLLCYLTTALFPNKYISLLGCGLCGLAVSMLWPGILSKSAEQFPKAGTLLFGALAFCGDIGCSIGPAVAGFVADGIKVSPIMLDFATKVGLDIEQLALRGGMLSCIIFPIILLICLLVTTKKPKQLLAE